MEKEVKKKLYVVLSQRLVFGNKTLEVGTHEVSQKEKDELSQIPQQNIISYL